MPALCKRASLLHRVLCSLLPVLVLPSPHFQLREGIVMPASFEVARASTLEPTRPTLLTDSDVITGGNLDSDRCSAYTVQATRICHTDTYFVGAVVNGDELGVFPVASSN